MLTYVLTRERERREREEHLINKMTSTGQNNYSLKKRRRQPLLAIRNAIRHDQYLKPAATQNAGTW